MSALPQSSKDVLANLITAAISVNGWQLQAALDLQPNLEDEGLFDLETLSRLTHEQLFEVLRRAGYSKSDFVTGLVVDRLREMARALSAGGMDTLQGLLKTDSAGALNTFLLSLKGVGPGVLANFRTLQGIP